MKIIYRDYAIYSDASVNAMGLFDVRVVLQKIGTTQITSHYPSCSALTKKESERQGTFAGRERVDMLMQKRLSAPS